MSDICPACGNYEKPSNAREDHVGSFLQWLDQNDICLRRLGDEEILDNDEILQQHVDVLREEEDDSGEW